MRPSTVIRGSGGGHARGSANPARDSPFRSALPPIAITGNRLAADAPGVRPDSRATSSTIEFLVEGPDKFQVMITNSTIGDERQDDLTMTYVRK